MSERNKRRKHRKRRITSKIRGTKDCPRVCVFKSNKALYIQFIDDNEGKTLAAVSSREMKEGGFDVKQAEKLGELAAKKALKAKIDKGIFDRGGYRYHGKIKAFADGLRKGGIKM